MFTYIITIKIISCPICQIRSFDNTQKYPIWPSEIFTKMFKNASPWIGSFDITDQKTYISQDQPESPVTLT